MDDNNGLYPDEGHYWRFDDIGSDIAGTGYDAATANWGTPWHMPSLTQIQELLNNCPSEWTQQNGVNGRLFTDPNGNSVFLPAVGYSFCGELYSEDFGFYWSSSLYEGGSLRAYSLYFSSGKAGWSSYVRNGGFTVRPVHKN